MHKKCLLTSARPALPGKLSTGLYLSKGIFTSESFINNNGKDTYMIINQPQCAEVKVLLSEKFDRIQFIGKRTLDISIKVWTDLSQLINNAHKNLLIMDEMTGVMNANEISRLIESIRENSSYKQKRIAIVLEESISYNSRFFDIVAKNIGIRIKHFNNEKDATDWLTQIQ